MIANIGEAVDEDEVEGMMKEADKEVEDAEALTLCPPDGSSCWGVFKFFYILPILFVLKVRRRLVTVHSRLCRSLTVCACTCTCYSRGVWPR